MSGTSVPAVLRRLVAVATAPVTLSLAPPLEAVQTITPLVVEYTGRAEGRFEVANTTLQPINVVLEAKSFDMDARGELTYRELDPSIELELSAMSFRIPPGQSRYVFYRARSAAKPAWFTVYALFTGLPRRDGMDVQVELPHTVLLYGESAARQDRLEIVGVHIDDRAGALQVDVHNAGERMARVLEAEVRGERSSRTPAGVPVLPGHTRRLTIPFESVKRPTLVRLYGDGFEVQHAIAEGGR